MAGSSNTTRPRRSGNPAIRAAEDALEVDSPQAAEAAGAPMTFEFADATWTVLAGTKPLKFQRLCEAGTAAAALQYALGDDPYEEFEDLVESFDEIQDAVQLVAKAMGSDSLGESRASRRSSRSTARP